MKNHSILSDWFALVRNHHQVDIWISEQVPRAIFDAASAAHPNETGGILAGVYAHGRPWITNMVEIPTSKLSAVHYELPEGERPKAIAILRKNDSRIGYLGEWHSHPANSGVSSLDKATMRDITKRREAVEPSTVLIVARRIDDHYVLDASSWIGRFSRRVRFIMAGPLRS